MRGPTMVALQGGGGAIQHECREKHGGPKQGVADFPPKHSTGPWQASSGLLEDAEGSMWVKVIRAVRQKNASR